MCDSDFMGKKGIRYFLRGPKQKIRVGFYNYEVVLAILNKYPEGLPVKKVADKAKIHYNTARHILFQMVEMNRVTTVERKVKKGGMIKHYQLTPWRIE